MQLDEPSKDLSFFNKTNMRGGNEKLVNHYDH